MAAPKSTVWSLEPHSKGKHLILEGYLKAWLPIISRWNKRILFIDGFAGPGIYKNGEHGSPLIALQTFKEHSNLIHSNFEMSFYFIEKDSARKKHLYDLIDKMKPDLPGNFSIHIEEGEFNESMSDVLDAVERQNKQLAPCFAMLDPFGVSHTPMSIVKRLLKNKQSEVYISFMYEWINRFKEHDNFEKHLDDLYGCEDWRDGIDIDNAEKRKKYLFDLYKLQLKHSGAKYVLHFELYEGSRLVYAIFYGTKHLTGCDRMKQAIWKVVPFGDFAFRGTHSSQMTLGLNFSDFTPLIKALQKKFIGQDWVDIQTVLDFVMSDETDFHSGQVKTNALRKLEEQNLIEVKTGTRKRAKQYPKGTILRFI